MPINIGNKLESDFRNPIGMLSDCHRRIERFLGALLSIAEQAAGGPIPEDHRKHFETALRYFSEAAPKHTLDEEESLFPRLLEHKSYETDSALAILEVLEAEHVTASERHSIIDKLGNEWLLQATLSEAATDLLISNLKRLQSDYGTHISLEENNLFPLADRLLTPGEKRLIALEMAGRRGVQLDTPSPAQSNSFSDLLLLHKELDEMFFEHQRALVRGDFESALQKLEDYERHLDKHIRDEETILLEIYGARVAAPLGGSVEIFLNEHRKIREYVVLFKAECINLSAAVDRERAAIFLLDSQTIFKKLMVHHDTRERKFLYPLLDDVTAFDERRNIFDKLELRPSQPRGL
jgi:hemerythrin-like domain-containing protein